MADVEEKRARQTANGETAERTDELDQRDQPLSNNSSFDQRHDDLQSMFKLRNGRGEVLQTPKRSSVTRARALLTTPPGKSSTPRCLTVTGADWQMATVVNILLKLTVLLGIWRLVCVTILSAITLQVTDKGMEPHLVQPGTEAQGQWLLYKQATAGL